MVQNFVVFMDRLVTAKIKTTNNIISMGGENIDIIINKCVNTPHR